MDEVLLARCARERIPILRRYDWSGDWISIGYFQKHGSLPPGRDAVRRATGGGTVDHRSGESYSLLLPREHPWGVGRAADLYLRFHGALTEALAGAGIGVAMVDRAAAAGPNGWCFSELPVAGDLVLDGRKVAGAALRRNREGVLLQGHLVLQPPPWDQIVRSLAPRIELIRPDAGEEASAADLAREKYGSPGWLRQR